MDTGTLIRASDELPSPSSVNEAVRSPLSSDAELLELHTELGPIYVCPSRWERIRLRWTFRHFHVLPPQVLSGSTQRLIKKLTRSAKVMPALPVAQDRILGVVESANPEPKLRGARPKPQRLRSFQPSLVASTPRPSPAPRLPVDPSPIPFPSQTDFGVSRKVLFVRDARSQQWGALGALAAVCLVVILGGRIFGFFHSPSVTPAASTPPAVAAPAKQLSAKIQPGPLPELAASTLSQMVPILRPRQMNSLPSLDAPSLAQQKPAAQPPSSPASVLAQGSAQTTPHPAQPPVSTPTVVHPVVAQESPVAAAPAPTPSDPARRFVSELPQGHFAEPVVTDPKLVGELRLKALIGADGQVKEVTVVSGDPKLAEVGMRAVRRWRYQALDHPGEAETLIRMRFFGEDGVSIASIAK
jgi:hypothetical protein